MPQAEDSRMASSQLLGSNEEGKGLPYAASEAYAVLLRHVGDGGAFQVRVFLIASFFGIFFAFQNLAAAFLAATPKFVCLTDHIPMDYDILGDSIINKSGIDWQSSKCHVIDIVSANESTQERTTNRLTHVTEASCDQWVYDDDVYRSTVVTEFDLVCDHRWLMTCAQSTYMAGVLVGAVVLSELSDLYGRRTISLVSSVLFIICSVSVAFSTHYSMFLVLRMLLAFVGSGIFLPNFVLVMEFAGPRSRTVIGMMYQWFFGVGFCLLPAIAYLVRDWRNLQLAISVPSVILLLYFKLLPESPLWLLCQGREEEAVAILSDVAKANKKSLPPAKELRALLNCIKSKKHHGSSLLSKVASFFKNQAILVRTPIMRRRCLTIFFSWFVVSMIYYGLAFSGDNMDASVYLMVFLSGIVEIPAYIIACLTTDKFGRRLNISFCFIVSGIACMLILAVPKDMVWLNITLASLGKFFNSVSFAIAYIYSAELVPTNVRNIAVGTSSMWARLGATIAPIIVDSLGEVHYAIPSTIFGLLSIAAGVLDLFLPETGLSPLPETIEEVEMMKR